MPDITGSTAAQNTPSEDSPQNTISKIAASPGLKFIMMGIITTLLLVPALLVWGLVEERASRARSVERDISQGWGGEQRINGPYLVLPYKATYSKNGAVKTVTRHAFLSADTMKTRMDVSVEERKKSIYSTPLYHSIAKLEGAFSKADISRIETEGGVPVFDAAFMVLGISDLAGIRSEVLAKIDQGREQAFKPGLRNTEKSVGIHLPVTAENAREGFKFDIALAFNGSRTLNIVPSAQNTALSLNSNWPHPGFDGRFLPETRQIAEDGFKAEWTIPNLARGVAAVSLSNQLTGNGAAMQVNFVKPLNFYQMVSRTLKYTIAFFSLVFLSVFIMEMTGKSAIHWIQYVLIGLALVVFYILLLALSEHVGFEIAYLVSAVATTGLISWYVGNAMQRAGSGLKMALVIGITYAIMFLLLREQDFALLAGAIIAFVSIAATMVITRKVDWSGSQQSAIPQA